VTTTDFVVTIATALSAAAAWVALGFSIYNAYARRKDRIPQVKMAATWNLPRDAPQVLKGPGSPATSDPGEINYLLEITNVGVAGVKITRVHIWLDEPPGKPIPLRLPQGEEPRRLEDGDSQTWSESFVLDGGVLDRGGLHIPRVTTVMAGDTVGRAFFAEHPDPFRHLREELRDDAH
jgi:hypothetical protein